MRSLFHLLLGVIATAFLFCLLPLAQSLKAPLDERVTLSLVHPMARIELPPPEPPPPDEPVPETREPLQLPALEAPPPPPQARQQVAVPDQLPFHLDLLRPDVAGAIQVGFALAEVPMAVPLDVGIYELAQVEVAPVYQAGPLPSYPRTAPRLREAVTVSLKFVVDETGGVQDPLVHETSRPVDQRVKSACLKAVAQWRFSPALMKGKPVSVYVIAPFTFEP